MVLISQALCYLSHPDLDDGDKEWIVDQAHSVPMVTLSFSAPQATITEHSNLGSLVCALDIGRALLKSKVGLFICRLSTDRDGVH